MVVRKSRLESVKVTLISNKKGFVLYDALVSLMLLAGTILFFNQLFVINSKANIQYQLKNEIINSLYYRIDHPEATDYNGVSFSVVDAQLCGTKDNEKVCISQ